MYIRSRPVPIINFKNFRCMLLGIQIIPRINECLQSQPHATIVWQCLVVALCVSLWTLSGPRLHCKKRRVVLTHIWLLQFHTLLDNSRRITLP